MRPKSSGTQLAKQGHGSEEPSSALYEALELIRRSFRVRKLLLLAKARATAAANVNTRTYQRTLHTREATVSLALP